MGSPPDTRDTRDTVQLWTQIVGKTRMALSTQISHWWVQRELCQLN